MKKMIKDYKTSCMWTKKLVYSQSKQVKEMIKDYNNKKSAVSGHNFLKKYVLLWTCTNLCDECTKLV